MRSKLYCGAVVAVSLCSWMFAFRSHGLTNNCILLSVSVINRILTKKKQAAQRRQKVCVSVRVFWLNVTYVARAHSMRWPQTLPNYIVILWLFWCWLLLLLLLLIKIGTRNIGKRVHSVSSNLDMRSFDTRAKQPNNQTGKEKKKERAKTEPTMRACNGQFGIEIGSWLFFSSFISLWIFKLM